MQEIKAQILDLLQILIGSIISIAGIYLTMYIGKAVNLVKEKAEHMKNEKTKALVNSTLDKVDDLISTNIIAVENTIKPTILEAIKNGTVDKSKLNSLSEIVKGNVLNQLNEESKKIFTNSLNDTNNYLQNRIEKILATLQASSCTGVNKTIIKTNITPPTASDNANAVQELTITNSTPVDIPMESSTALPK